MCKHKKNLKHFMKCRRNSINKVEKQMFEAKIFIKKKYSPVKTGCDLCLQRLIKKPTKKLFKNMTRLKNPNMFLKTNIFKSHNRLKISTKSDGLDCDNSASELSC